MADTIDKAAKRRSRLLKKVDFVFDGWWGPRSGRPALIFSFLAVDVNEDRTFEAQEERWRFLCKTLVKILPSNALVIAGKKGSMIDNMLRDEFSRLLTSKRQTMTTEEAVLDKKTDEDPFELSMYYEDKNMCLKTHNWRKTAVQRSFYETVEDLLANDDSLQYRLRREDGQAPKARVILAKIRIDEEATASIETCDRFVVIRPKFREVLTDDGEKTYNVKLFSKSVHVTLFRYLVKDKSGLILHDLICGQWFDDILSRAILEQVSKRRIPKFFIESGVDEKWMRDYLDSISDPSDQKKPKHYQQLGTGGGRGGGEDGGEGGGEGFEPMALETEERLVPERRSSETKTKIKKKSYMKHKILLIWCVQEDMSTDAIMKFWRKGKDKLAMALKGYKTAKTLREKYESTEATEALKSKMQFFENLAIEHLLRCHSAAKGSTTSQLLVGRVRELDDCSPIEIAMEDRMENFTSQLPCVLLMDGIWIEPLRNYKKYNYLTFAISLVIPFLAPLLMDLDLSSELFEADVDEDVDKLKREYCLEERCCISTKRSLELQSEHRRCAGLRNGLIRCIDYFWKVRTFLQASVVRFVYALVFHVAYLILFSYVLLSNFHEKISAAETVLDVWTLILAIEEVKQAVEAVNEKEDYFNKWNLMDNLGLILFLCGFLLRAVYHVSPNACPECLYVARIVLAFSLLFFFTRSLQLLIIHATLGPKIYMMTQLLGDLVSFMLILLVFMAAFGVTSNVILYPNQPLNFPLVADIFYNSWWSVLGQYTREEVSGSNCAEDLASNITAEYCSSTTDVKIDYVKCKQHKCPANNWIVSILLALYALVTVIMMLNVLIAMFNNTFSSVESKRREVHNLQRYRLMREYSIKSVIPVPLCFVTYWRFVPWCVQRCCGELFQKGKEFPKRKLWTLFRRNSSERSTLIEDTVVMEKTRDAATEDEVEELNGVLTNLTRSQFEFVRQMIFGLSKKTSE